MVGFPPRSLPARYRRTSQSLSVGALDHKRKSLAHWVALAALCCLLSACTHFQSTEVATEVVVVTGEPRCRKIGVIEGVGGGPESAIAEAKRRASEKGATHMVLGKPAVDIDEGLTTVVAGTLFECLPPELEFPATGYP